MEGTGNRVHWIDIAKGLGIILVIMGHTMFPVHFAIDVFHMPLFFFLAGLTLKHQQHFRDFLIAKINRIFIPYVFFYSLILIVQFLIRYDGPGLWFHLWFLQSMFIAILIAYAIVSNVNSRIGALICVIFLIYGWAIARFNHPILPLNIDRGLLSAGFVLLGYYSKPLIIRLSNLCRASILFISLLFFSAFSFSVYFSLKYYNPICSFSRMDLGEYSFFLCMITTLLGILTILAGSIFIKKCSLLEWLGRNSLVIFIFHLPFTEWLNKYFGSFAEGKGLIIGGVTAIIAYIVFLSIGSLFVPLCKKFLPKVSGYSNLIA